MQFRVQSNRKDGENKTIHFPLCLIERLNQAIVGKDISFSSFVIQACEFALDNLNSTNITTYKSDFSNFYLLL